VDGGPLARIFCYAERRSYPAAEFAQAPNGIEIHVITPTTGHTTEGWGAKYQTSRGEPGEWILADVVITNPPIDDVAADVSDDNTN
jgi:hypothetical protein